MWLCGVRIDSPMGFVAHSDGDVAIHALCDALLGALALGDIGHHFPDSSDEFKGIDSKILLERVMDMVRGKGYTVGNVDITIALQAPKIGRYVLSPASSEQALTASASRPPPPSALASSAAAKAARPGPSACSFPQSKFFKTSKHFYYI